MWSRVVTVVIVSCLVSSVVSVADLEDNVVPEDSLQDLTVRIKKSPVEDNEKTPSQSESKSDSELKAVLTEDIKRKIDDLKELKNAYHKVEADFFGSESQTLKPSIEKSSSEILGSESSNPVLANSAESDDESVRVARTFFSLPSSFSLNIPNLNQKYDSQKDTLPENRYSNEKYQSISSTDSSGDKDAPYIAQYNPSSRTFGAAGFNGGFHGEHHKVPDIKPEVSIHTPGISIKPVELVLPATPVHTAPPAVNLVLPASLPTVTVSEHKPYEAAGHNTKHETNVPLYYEKKEIGTPGSFFSKQIILGPSKDYGEGNSYYPYTSYSSYPHGNAYYQPEYSSYPQVYPYGGSSSHLYAADGHSSPGYSSYPDAHANYNYRPEYSPGYYYQQGHAYYPAGGNYYKSNRDLSTQFQRYQDELDSVLSQFFRAGPVGDKASSANSTVDQLTGDIEREEKKILMLQEELKSPQGSNDNAGVSQSFVKWLSEEMDAVYSKWIHLKDDITKTKHDSGASA